MNLIKRVCGAAALLMLLCAQAVAQIEGPTESEPYKLIHHKLVTPIPEGCYLADGGWEVIGASTTVVADVEEHGDRIVWTGTPGIYALKFDAVILKDVTFKDGDGNMVTIRSYMGKAKGSGTTKIKGTPGPDPPIPPVPGGKYQLVLWCTDNQLDNLSRDQRDILTSLVFRDWMRAQGHVFLELLDPANFSNGVPEKWQPWVTSVLNKPLPAVSLSPIEGGAIVTYALPKDVVAMKAFLAAPAVRKAVRR